MAEYPNISRENNFDLIRLFAALQVVFFHVQDRLGIIIPYMDWFRNFKGVPIFFTVSGFLITSSFLRNKNEIRVYFINRYLRLFPALYVLIIATTLSALFLGCISINNIISSDYLKWVIRWASYDQNYTPAFWQLFGTGIPNGSLWTIPVELSFYILIPFMFFIKRKNLLFIIIFSLSIISIYSNYLFHDFNSINPTIQTFTFSIIPYLYYFFIGAFMYLMWGKIKPYVENKFFYYFGLLIFLIISDAFSPSLGFHTSMKVHTIKELVMNLLLIVTTISAAFTQKNAAKILHGKDLSYGIYLYHGLIINIVIELVSNRSFWLYILVFSFSILSAWFSWNYVEKPCLAMKTKLGNFFVNNKFL